MKPARHERLNMLDDSTLRKLACERLEYLPESGLFIWKVRHPVLMAEYKRVTG